MASFTPLRELSVDNPVKLDGTLTLMWADTWCSGRDVSPASGIGIYGGRSVLFFVRDPQAPIKRREFMLYDLSPESWIKVRNNRLAFRKVFGLRDEFGRTQELMAKAEIRDSTYHYFTPQYVVGDLEVVPLGYVWYSSIDNPFPHSPIAQETMDIINEFMVDDNSVSKPDAELPYAPNQVMEQLAARMRGEPIGEEALNTAVVPE